MQETAGEISWARTAGLTVAVAGFLFVAEPLAALAVILFSGIAPGCDRCSNTQPSALATYLLVAVLAGVGSIGVALVVAWCLGRRRALLLGRPRIIACSIVIVLLPPLCVLGAARVDRAQHVSGKASWEIPMSLAVASGLAWVGGVRWITNRRVRGNEGSGV